MSKFPKAFLYLVVFAFLLAFIYSAHVSQAVVIGEPLPPIRYCVDSAGRAMPDVMSIDRYYCPLNTIAVLNQYGCNYICRQSCTADSDCATGETCIMDTSTDLGYCSATLPPRIVPVPETCITAIEDSYVKENTPAVNYGGSTEMKAGTEFQYTPPATYPSNIIFELAYFKFDQAQFPKSYTKATLKLSQSGCDSGAGGMENNLHKVTSPWSESTLVWGNKPTFDAANWGTKRMGCGEAPSDSWYQWDITSYLKSTTIPYGLMLADYRYTPSCDGNYSGGYISTMCRAGAGRETFLNSKETLNKPQLCFETDPCAGVTCASGETCYQAKCYRACSTDSGCPAGSVCTGGACIPSGSSSSSCQKSLGDANCDGLVNETDYTIWRCEYLGTCSTPSSTLRANFNNDTQVDLIDFEIWRSKVYGTTNIPTPPAP